MLVEHDVEAELVAQEPLVVIAVKQIGCDPGIEMAVRQVDPQRALVLLPGVRVGLLGEVIHAHGMSSGRYEAAKARTRSAKICGCSTWGKWAAFTNSPKRAPGMAAQ